jgi:hypothetical protein
MSKVIIVGGGIKRRFFKDIKGAEVWVCNGQMNSFTWLPRVDKAFNLHRHNLLKQYGYNFDGEADFVRENPTTPFLTMDKWPKWLVPNWVAWELFPWAEMNKKQPRGMYHCGTFDWMIAYADFIGVKEVNIHGVNLRLEATEPGMSQTCLEYWCGYATGRGMKITAAKDTTMFYYSQIVLSNTTYGLDDAPIYKDLRPEGMEQYDYRP